MPSHASGGKKKVDSVEFVKDARASGHKVWIDLDDNVIDERIVKDTDLFDGYSRAGLRQLRKNIREQSEMLSLVDGVLLSTDVITEVALKFQPHSKTFLNCIPDFYFSAIVPGEVLPDRNPDEFSVYYGPGSLDHRIHFDVIDKGLVKFLSNNPKASLAIGGGLTIPEVLKPFAPQIRRYPRQLPQLYFRNLANFSCSLAPLKPDLFASAKSWIKALEAAARGVPWLGSEHPAYRLFHEATGSGQLVSPDKDSRNWADALQAAFDERHERSAAAKAQQADILSRYRMGARTQEYMDILASV